MLDEEKITFEYRDYFADPLTEEEIKNALTLLGKPAKEMLRTHEEVFERLGLTGDEDEAFLIEKMADYPQLLQRPIGILGEKAAVGRPVENLLTLIESE